MLFKIKKKSVQVISFLKMIRILLKNGNTYCFKKKAILSKIIWYRIPKNNFHIIIENLSYFPFIVAFKIVNKKYYVGAFITNKEFLNLSLNGFNADNAKLSWTEFKMGVENIIINKFNPSILGYSLNNKERSIYEYLERACSFFLKPNEQIINTDMTNTDLKKLSYKDLGFYWGNKIASRPIKNWIKAKSVFQKKEYLVPYNSVYYGKIIKSDEHSFGSSNGIALGSGFIDTYKRALFEFVERDILISSWLGHGSALLHVNLDNFKISPFLKPYINIYIYDKKVNHRYVIWCFLKNLNDNYFSSSGFSVHRNFKAGVEHALEEGYSAFLNKHENKNDKLDIIENYYSNSQNKKKIEALYEKSGNITLNNIGNLPNVSTQSLYSDIIYKDITVPEILDLGFHCVKVFGLGGKSMYFDYNLTDQSLPKYLPIA